MKVSGGWIAILIASSLAAQTSGNPAQPTTTPQSAASAMTAATTPPLAPIASPSGKKSGSKNKPALLTAKSTPPELALKTYIERVRAHSAAETQTPGSLWSDSGTMVRLSTDVKAVHLYDVVQIVVSETLAAETDGAVKNSRASSANAQITALFGAIKSSNALQNLMGQNAASALTAQGQSTTNSSLATAFGGEVVDVLPNGMLVVEAVRQLTFSQQTQLIKLRGLVRPEDVNASNQVQSSAMTDLELEVTGRGIINDTTYRQNPLVRFLQKILIF
jgi:flagellar L-ring protein precursor FlgH